MLKASSIICVFDSSSASRDSLPMAVELARTSGASLRLVLVVPNRSWSLYTMVTYDSKLERAKALEEITPFVRELMSRTPELTWDLRVGASNYYAEVIESLAEESGADLLISARHRGRLEFLKSWPKEEAAADSPAAVRPDFLPAQSAGAGMPHQVAAA